MSFDWSSFRLSLKRFRQSGMELPIWWRDDDAVSATPALDKLCALSEGTGVDVAVATIPDLIDQSLVDYVHETQNMIPVTHGWRHENHAAEGEKKSEFVAARDATLTEVQAGFSIMQEHFCERFEPIFVPPWNRFDPSYLADLSRSGYAAISAFTPRKARFPAPNLLQLNTHFDPIDWRGGRDLHEIEKLAVLFDTLLEDRRTGATDATEPLGYLSHHLVHSERLWEFSRQFLTELLDGGATAQPIPALLEPSNEQT